MCKSTRPAITEDRVLNLIRFVYTSTETRGFYQQTQVREDPDLDVPKGGSFYSWLHKQSILSGSPKRRRWRDLNEYPTRNLAKNLLRDYRRHRSETLNKSKFFRTFSGDFKGSINV